MENDKYYMNLVELLRDELITMAQVKIRVPNN